MVSFEDREFGSEADSYAAHKKFLRTDIRRARRLRREVTSDADRAVAAHRTAMALVNHEAVQAAHCVALYEALPTEEDVSDLTRLAPRAERFIVPVTLPDKDLSWRDLRTGQDLGLTGIALADVVVAPALAVGRNGERLGQGGGSYDRALPRRAPGTPVIAVVFPDEVGLDVPTEPHDEPVDAVATRDGLVLFDKSDAQNAPASNPEG